MSKAKAPRVFVPLTKVDEEQRLVYGTITQEVLDKSGEVMDYEKSKPHFEKWSNDIHTASGGLSKGNLRVMHGLTVAGKLTELEFDDENKTIEVCSKVVDDSEWNKVLEGCYTGFSVGGKYGKKWKDTVDGQTVQKYEAIPNEVSLVDNPCVPSATFSLVKADGAEEQVMFKAAADQAGENEPTTEQAVSEEADNSDTPEQPDASVEKAASASVEPKSEDVAKLAGELAAAANDGTAWVDHIETARAELMKAASTEEATNETPGPDESQEAEEEPSTEGADEADPNVNDSGADSVEKVTPAGVKQQWTTSDGQAFDKKDDAVAHENELAKAAEPETEAEKLRKRLEAATTPKTEEGEPVSIFSFDRIDDLHKAVLELEQPREQDGSPKLEKGMYTVSRFANMLGSIAEIAKTIKAESKLEQDGEDEVVWKTLQSQLGSFGESFMTYAKDQVAELVAGLDTDLTPWCAYDYYYHAAGQDNDLAKNVVEMIEAVEPIKEAVIENIEKLAKSVGFIGATLESTDEDELSPPMQKRFDSLEAENAELRKVAESAVEKVEEFAKRLAAVEDQPLPRAPAPGAIAFKEGDVQFLGKNFSNADELMSNVHDLIKTKGPDALAVELIKASQASGGQRLHLNR